MTSQRAYRLGEMLVVGILFTLLGLLVNGYRYGIWDHAIYLPMIEQAARPDLFPGDYIFDPASGLASTYQKDTVAVPVLALFRRHFSMESVLFVAYLISQVALFGGVYALSLTLFNSRGAATLALLLLVVPKWIAGTSTFTYDVYLTFRNLAMPLTVAFLIAYYRNAMLSGAVIGGVAFLIHPTTAFPIMCVFAVWMAGELRREWRRPLAGVLLVSMFCAPQLIRVFVTHYLSSAGGSFVDTADWIAIIRWRNPYTFVSTWGRDVILATVAYTTILAGALLSRSRESAFRDSDRRTTTVAAVCAGLFVVGFIFVEWLPVPVILQLQLQRSFHLVIHLAIIYAAWLAWEEVGRRMDVSGYAPFAARVASRVDALVPPLVIAGLTILLVTRSADREVLAAAGFVWWRLTFGIRETARALTFRGALAGSLWIALVLAYRETLLQDGVRSTAVVSPIAWACVVFTLFLALSRWGQPVDQRRRQSVARVGLVAAAFSALILFSTPHLRELASGDGFLERIQLPGFPLRTEWKFPDGRRVNDWIDVARWAGGHTNADAAFLVPPDIADFRTHSRRAMVGDWEDGTMSLFSSRFALTWRERMMALAGYDQLEDRKFAELAARYHASFAVTRSSQRLGFPIAYSNEGFTVYDVKAAPRHERQANLIPQIDGRR